MLLAINTGIVDWALACQKMTFDEIEKKGLKSDFFIWASVFEACSNIASNSSAGSKTLLDFYTFLFQVYTTLFWLNTEVRLGKHQVRDVLYDFTWINMNGIARQWESDRWKVSRNHMGYISIVLIIKLWERYM